MVVSGLVYLMMQTRVNREKPRFRRPKRCSNSRLSVSADRLAEKPETGV